jgi:guanylate kinase
MTIQFPGCQRFPRLIILSGPSGVGKDTIAQMILAQRPDEFHFVVTATTRASRAGETHGRDYFFVSSDEFARMINEGELLEYAIVYNDFKGIPKQQIREALASGKNVLMRVDVQGAATVKRLVPAAVSIFLSTPSEEELARRLRQRQSDSGEGLNLRIATARQEMRRLNEFDYCVVNAEDEQERAVEQILSIVEAERCRVSQQPVLL